MLHPGSECRALPTGTGGTWCCAAGPTVSRRLENEVDVLGLIAGDGEVVNLRALLFMPRRDSVLYFFGRKGLRSASL